MAVSQNAESLQQHFLEKVILVLAALDYALRDNLAGFCAQEIEIRIIHFKPRLALEPAETHEQTEDNARAVFVAAGFLREDDNILGYDLGVRAGDLGLFELEGNNGFDPGRRQLGVWLGGGMCARTYRYFNRSATFVTLLIPSISLRALTHSLTISGLGNLDTSLLEWTHEYVHCHDWVRGSRGGRRRRRGCCRRRCHRCHQTYGGCLPLL